ncbi:hypothetical protein OAA19_00255 [Rubripirellula sp.]|nr:hypothetical protein [Rubripirellula sp.]MDB4338518.1 hypothetical protein [Rubripirellula sp.]
MQLRPITFITTSLLAISVCADVASAQLIVEEMISMVGTVESVSNDLLVVKDDTGEAHSVRVQSIGKESVRLAGGQFLRSPAQIVVTGRFEVDDLRPGQNLSLQCKMNRLGRTSGVVGEISLVTGKGEPNGITVVEEGSKPSDHSTCKVVAQLSRLKNGRLIVKVPPNNGFTRMSTLSFSLAKDATVSFVSDAIDRAGAGSRVTKLVAKRLNTGDIVAQSLEIEVSGETTAPASVDDSLLTKYRHLSDEPLPPRLIRSQHYAFMTDVSERQARIILDKLETMTLLLSKYFGQVPSGVVEGFIVRDLSGWPDGLLEEPAGVAKIQDDAGICFNTSLGNRYRAVLYSCDDHGVIQHECTHGFCHLTFGSTGPTWLAEGMAEMGQYWKFDQPAVDINPVVLNYLRGSDPKRRLLEIAVPGRVDSGSWRDYAWRWALCHLLVNNPNYADRFKPLAIALMKNREGATFEAVYGPSGRQLAFEYALFLETMDNGYRVDLCAWQWNRKFSTLAGRRRTQTKVAARFGWQATGVSLEKGAAYDLAAIGNWKIAKDGGEYDADGDQVGRGKLVAVIFNEFQLSEEFPVGKLSEGFVSPTNGQLFLRCRDDWNQLADNAGELTVHIRKSPENL